MKWTKAGVELTPNPYTGTYVLNLALDLSPENYDAAVKLLQGNYEIVLQKRQKPRSLNANAYFWKLADELAKVLQITKEEVYARAIKQVGVYEVMTVSIESYSHFKKIWESNGIGWIVDRLCDDGVNATIHAYYGSSTYNSSQMARLIDWLVQEAEEQGIETLTPRERSLLIDQWSDQWSRKENKG